MLGSIFISGYNIQLQNLNIFLCKIYFYISFLFATVSPSILILASIDRLLISSQNINRRLYSSIRLAYFSLSLSSFLWIVYNSHILIKVHIQEFYPSIFICYYDLSKIYLDFVTYSVMTINVLFYILMFILSMFAFKNVRHFRIVPRQQRNQIRSMTKKDFQLLRCLFAHDIVFIICSFAINIYYVYEGVTHDQIRTEMEQAIVNFFNYLSSFPFHISYCVGFFIFVSISKGFRQELKRTIYKFFGRETIILRENGNRRDHVELNVVPVSTVLLSRA